MELLGLLLQLLKASLGIEVDGILCDLALQVTMVSSLPRDPGIRRKAWTSGQDGRGGDARG
jgi:hypothetical protein